MNSLLRRRLGVLITSAALIALSWALTWWGTFASAPLVASTMMIAAAVIAGTSIANRAIRDLLHRRVSIELLVTIAVTGALIIGEYWEAAAVTFLFVFGAALEAGTVGKTRQAVSQLLDLAPDTATVIRDGEQVEVDAYDVHSGETVLIRAGGKIPVDGQIISGHAAIDESSITGESVAASKTAGDQVFAGTTLGAQGGSLLRVEATGTGDDTTLSRIIDRVEEAQESKAPAQRAMERFASWYTPSVVALAVIVFAFTRNIETALTLLVIACPGALVISMPVTFVAGIGRAAQRGILVKGGQYLEDAAAIDTVAFDKTGTLTAGRPVLVSAAGYSGASTSEALYWAAVAETGSDHPLATPIIAAARGENPDFEAVAALPTHPDHSETVPGRGVLATHGGRELIVGSLKYAEELYGSVSDDIRRAAAQHADLGRTPVVVGLDGRVLGLLTVADQIRETTPKALEALKRVKVAQTVMLTGDDARVANAIGTQLGIDDVRAGLLPEHKLSAVNELTSAGQKVAMVGDGINDAPALAASDVGIAMGGSGTAVAVETADVALMTDDLTRVAELVHFARRTRRVLRQNLVIALGTVALLMAGVLFAGTTMAVGMLVHEVSVLVVVANAVRLLAARPPRFTQVERSLDLNHGASLSVTDPAAGVG